MTCFPDGPVDVAIVRPEIGPVGPELYVSPGSTTGLLCSSECYPNCSYTWIYNGKPVALKADFSLTSGTPVHGGPLTCVANNPVTKENISSETMVIPIGMSAYPLLSLSIPTPIF